MTVIAVIFPLDTVAVAVARAHVGEGSGLHGGAAMLTCVVVLLYPLPDFVTVMPATDRGARVAVPVAPEPPPPVIVTVGAEV